ncbi:recombinase family protein, partial [Roseovarius sp. PS-C2]|nr:recombinase family protein [Roseovarius sp. PS-C2]
PEDLSDDALAIEAPFKTRRRGIETKIIVGDMKPAPDRTLLRGLAKAHRWAANLQEGIPISEIARRENVSEAYIRMRVQLAFLSPKL